MQFFTLAFAALAAASPMIAERAAEPAALANNPGSYDNYNGDYNGGHNGGWNGGNNGGNNGGFNGRQFRCPGLLQTPQCCQTDVLDLLSLTCEPPRSDAFSRQSFKAECASTGATANCCLLPVLGQGLICQDV